MTEADKPKKSKFKRFILIPGGILLLLCVVIAIAGALLGDDTSSTPSPTSAPQEAAASQATSTPKPTDTPIPTNTPIPIADITYNEIATSYDEMTDAQWKAYVDTIEGKRVVWTGWVVDAKEKGTLYVDMENPEENPLSMTDCYVPIPKEDVLSYNVNQRVIIDGMIDDVSTLLGKLSVHFEDDVIVTTEES